MLIENDVYGKRTLDFVEKLQKLTSYVEIRRQILAEIEWYGFSCVSGLSMPGPGENLVDCVLLNNRPKEFVDRYIEQNYIAHDPVIAELRRTTTPFSWGDVCVSRDLSKLERRIIDEARDFGANDGFVVPIVTPSGSTVVFSFCGLEPNLSERARAAVEIIGLYSFHSIKQALDRQSQSETAYPPLTPREREIMHWVAAGKSDDEIADRLSLSTRTVAWHIENAKLKLDACRRSNAVIQAIRLGELAL